MDQDGIDLLKHLLESQSEQLEAIREELGRVHDRLVKLEVKEQINWTFVETVKKLFSSWQLWAIILVTYISNDMSRVKAMISSFIGVS